MMHSTISCLNPLLLIRDGHVTPVAVRQRRRATKGSVYLARGQEGGEGARISVPGKEDYPDDAKPRILDDELGQISVR